MPRQPRIDSPGSLHHVMARGIDRSTLFHTSRDYEDFLARFVRLLREFDGRCFAWSLMPNHIHFLIRSGAQGLSRMLQRLLTGYAVSFNRRYNRVGHLFQNRFKSILCEEEPYFLELVRYIHLNPVRAGLVHSLKELRQYPWTGHTALMGDIRLLWQSTDEVLQRWSDDPSEARRRYEVFLSKGLEPDREVDLEGNKLFSSPEEGITALLARATGLFEQRDVRILGSEDFVLQTLSELDAHLPNPRHTPLHRLLAETAERTGVPREAITSTARTRSIARAKSLWIYWGVKRGGKTLREMARLTGMSDGAASQALHRGENIEKTWQGGRTYVV